MDDFIKVKLTDVMIGQRARQDAGDILALSESIKTRGLIHPITINEKMELVAGWRRIMAYQHLGWNEIPAYVCHDISDALAKMYAERDENTMREPFKPSEAVSLGKRIEEIERPRADAAQKSGKSADGKAGGRGKKKPKGKFPQGFKESNKTSNKVGPAVGMSGRTYEKAKQVVESGDAELIETMDADGKVDKAHKQLKRKQQREQEKRAAEEKASSDDNLWSITDVNDVIDCSAIITDPPYGILDEDWEPDELESFTRDWCERWNSSGADFIAVFFSQRYLFDAKTWFDESFSDYEFQQLLVWHYANNKSPQSRMGFKQTWEPVFFYRRIDCDRQVKMPESNWGDGITDFDCHCAAVPQSNFTGADMKVHPAQKPVSVMKWLVNCLSSRGDLIVDPFCGSGTTGIASVQLDRRFHGIERNEEFLKLSEERIACYGT